MDHVFLRGQIHQKAFGRSPPRHNSEVRFYRYRRDADPSPFFKTARQSRARCRPGGFCWKIHPQGNLLLGDPDITIHMVSAFAARQRLVLGQLKVTEKSNEIIAIQSCWTC